MQCKFTIKVPVYNFNCSVVFTDSVVDTANKQTKKYNLEPLTNDVYGFAMGTNTVHQYFLFYDVNDITMNTISHEISHLIDFVFTDRGVDPQTGEPRAYLTGYITEEIYDYIIRKKLQLKKWEDPTTKKKSKETSVQNQSLDSQTSNNL
jgi:hypothetical protein